MREFPAIMLHHSSEKADAHTTEHLPEDAKDTIRNGEASRKFLGKLCVGSNSLLKKCAVAGRMTLSTGC